MQKYTHRIIFNIIPNPTGQHGGGAKVRRHVRRLASLKDHRREHRGTWKIMIWLNIV